MNPLFQISRAQRRAGTALGLPGMILEFLQNAAASRVGNGVKYAVERGVVRRHESDTTYFFRIGLYPSAIKRVRIASASFTSENGPTCTRNSLSVWT